jgi:thymidylate synthase ThyX
MNSEFTQEESKVLAPYFTNLDKPVFALTNLPEVVKGALFSRYSRSDKSLRRILLDEFIKDKEMGFKEIVGAHSDSHEQMVAIKKAEEFYDRVLVGYGDDSVAELGGCHIAVEQVSNIAAKFIEDSRLGISPLEKSTRYVYFDKKVNGNYLYRREKRIMESRHADLYIRTCDMLFDEYSVLIEDMKKFLIEKFPKETEVSDRAYNSTIKAKACDVLRNFLPAATITNIGLFGNGRAFEYLLTKMYSSDLQEMNDTATSMQEELSKVIPSFVKRAKGEYGNPTIKFMAETRDAIAGLAKKMRTIEKPYSKEVELVSFDKDAEIKICAAALYPHSNLSLGQMQEKARRMSHEERMEIIKEYCGKRQNRRHKPGRAFEHAYYEFDLLLNFASYRDLHRHRVQTQQRQLLTVEHGFDVQPEMREMGIDKRYEEAMKAAAEAFWQIHKEMPKEAQYIVPFGYRVRWSASLNLRELYHLVELRSTIHGHPDYRRLVINMYEEVKKVQPQLVEWMKFVDRREIGLERLESEKMLDKKMEEVKKKYGK